MKSTPDLKILIKEKEIKKKVKELGKKISDDYSDKKPLVIGILKGAFLFMADLIRQLSINIELDFIELTSYGAGKESCGHIKVVKGLNTNLKNKDIIIIEDIVDSGLTISFLIEYLKKSDPSSIKVCTLTSKPERREIEVTIDYLGFEIPNKFIVGYGLDYCEAYRNLSAIYYLEDD